MNSCQSEPSTPTLPVQSPTLTQILHAEANPQLGRAWPQLLPPDPASLNPLMDLINAHDPMQYLSDLGLLKSDKIFITIYHKCHSDSYDHAVYRIRSCTQFFNVILGEGDLGSTMRWNHQICNSVYRTYNHNQTFIFLLLICYRD